MLGVIETDISDVIASAVLDVIEGALGNTSEAITGVVVFDDPMGTMETSTIGISLACGLSDSEVFGEIDVKRLCDTLSENDTVAMEVIVADGSADDLGRIADKLGGLDNPGDNIAIVVARSVG